jgi:fluoride exporter
MNLLIIAIGGALGSVARYLSTEIINKFVRLGTSFPIGTFFVNISGSLLAGIIYYFIIKNFDNFDPRLKLFLVTGFLGGFTTFSAFSLDFFRLATAGQYIQAATYAATSVILSILAVFFGFYLAKIIFS